MIRADKRFIVGGIGLLVVAVFANSGGAILAIMGAGLLAIGVVLNCLRHK
ncbi:hypothetical protein [Streptomyces sp. NPDC050485]